MKVAILGAGPSGLVAAKEAIHKGFSVTIFEKSQDIGGVWNSETGAVWQSMRTNISKFTCAFSDFPWPKESATFPKASEMLEYLRNYTKTHGITQYIHFNSTVKNVDKDTSQHNKWIVKSEEDGKITSESFDAVVVATGIFNTPVIPEIPGSYHGVISHSKDYKSPQGFVGKKVLVVGNSFSGTEIAADISNLASKVTHLYHNPFIGYCKNIYL